MSIKNVLIIIILMVNNSNAFGQTAREISDKSRETVDFKALEMALTLKIYDSKGRVRTRKISTASIEFGKINKTIIKFTEPADVKGTALLIYDYKIENDKMWIYMPAIRKTRRIVSSEKSKSFMGSEFTNADMSTPNANDFNCEIISSEILQGHSCWKIETRCKNEDIEDENGFSKKISWIEKERFLCHKIEFYDLGGELHKIQSIDKYQIQTNGKFFAFQMQMENKKNGRKSSIVIDKLQTNSTLSENTFTSGMLKKL